MNTVTQTLGAADVREIAGRWAYPHLGPVNMGLPEWDGRLRCWRVSIVSSKNSKEPVGEIRVNSEGDVVENSNLSLTIQRCQSVSETRDVRRRNKQVSITPIPSKIILGDADKVLDEFPPNTAQLVFTSPPYFNAKIEAYEEISYSGYMRFLKDIFTKCHAILSEGRFLVVNTSPVLIKRVSRSTSSKRLPIPYDLHPILMDIGFDFIDDIIWEKPEGAGWNIGRGRRFAADRQPLQYKAVSVTENIMVYRKKTDRLIDWNIRRHPDPETVKSSKIQDGYEITNVWRIPPAFHKDHPCVFPDELVERVVRYYSFKNDMVLDPFSGAGTTGKVCGKLGRRFLMIERLLKYFKIQEADETLSAYGPHICDYQYGDDLY